MSPKLTILALNSGSSSLKFGRFDAGTCEGLVAGEIDWGPGLRAWEGPTISPRPDWPSKPCPTTEIR